MEREEAIEVVKKNYPYINDSISQFETALRTLIPELAESEDERTWIINYLSNRILNSPIIAEKENLKKAIAWLEKQGEQKPAWSEEDEKFLSDIIKDLVHPWNEYIPDRIEDEIKWLKNKLKSLKERYTWKPSDLPHWQKSTLPNDNTTGFNSDYFCHKGYNINYKELFEKLPKDD
jgi:hypothetical protein